MAFQVSDVTGIGVSNQMSGPGPYDHLGVMRRDPSDVIKIDNEYYVFYTKAARYPDGEDGGQVPRWPTSGYWGTVWYATSPDGTNWTEQSEVLGPASPGAWDSNGVFTPNVIQGADQEYYLYYTGVQDGFINNSTTDIAQIGVAQIAFGQDGFISGATRLNQGEPILAPTFGEVDATGAAKFDSFRVDDASLLRWDYDDDGELEYGLYYKGRAQTGTPAETKMGLAIGESPGGPFLRHNNGDPVQPEGHEVLIWAYGDGVMSLASSAGRGLWYAEDGVAFTELTDEFVGSVHAPGAYRPELTEHDYRGGIEWGISMKHAGNRYLAHFELNWTPSTANGDLNGDGLIDEADWHLYQAGFGADLSGMTTEAAHRLGDLNGDLLNNELDFSLFKRAYEQANGAGAFQVLTTVVPEPASSAVLLGCAIVGLMSRRSLRGHHVRCNRRRENRRISSITTSS